MGLGHCGLGTALMPNENLSGEREREREWTPGRGGDQGNKVRQGDSDIFVSKSEKISLL